MKKKKNYTIINKDIHKYRVGKNRNEDIYLYAFIKVCSDFKTGVSHATQERLAELTKIPLRTIQSCTKRLKESDLIDIETTHIGIKKHNTYRFDTHPSNFFFVDNSFYYIDIDVKLKGLMLLIKSLCINNSNATLYNRTKIAEMIGQDRGTVSKMINELIEKGLLIKISEGFVLPANYFPIYSKDKRSEHSYEKLDSCDEFVLNSILEICRKKGTTLFTPDLSALKGIYAKYPLQEKDIQDLDEEDLCRLYLPKVLESRCSSLPNKIESINYFSSVLNVSFVKKTKTSEEITL